MPGDPPKWHIDTLDALGGLAFATWRPADLAEVASLPDRPVFHFSPPAFTPSPVASAATALAAERHGFQLGLYDEHGEVPFDTLADVAEFVRRIYVGTGRSDGTDGGGVPPVPPPEPEPLVPSEGFEYAQAEVGWLRLITSEFQQMVIDTPRGSSWTTAWREFENGYDLDKASTQASPVLLGAELTLLEMLQRFPNNPEQRETWQQTAMRLASTLLRTGAAQLLLEDGTRPIHKTCRAFLRKLWSHKLHSDFERFPLYWTIEAMIAPNGLSWPPFWWGLTPPPLLPPLALAEPLDDLAYFPASATDAAAAAAPDVQTASVADVLSSVLASPTRRGKSSTLDAIVAFAAARIVAFDGARWTGAQLRLNGGDHSQARDLNRARFERLTLEAYKWLSRELPTRAFSPSVEALIENGLADPLEEAAKASFRAGKAAARHG